MRYERGASLKAMTEADFAALKREWRASPIASFLSRHALCVGTLEHDAAVLAWLEAGGLRCWCRYHGETLEAPDSSLPRSAEDFWTVLCVGVVTDHPQLFLDDPSGELLAVSVNRLALVLRRAALLSTAGGEAPPPSRRTDSAARAPDSCKGVVMWRKDPDPADQVMEELARLREEVEALRKRIRTAQRFDRRTDERRQTARPFSNERRRAA